MEFDGGWSLLKSSLLLAAVGFVAYKIIGKIQKIRSYAKTFNDCPGDTYLEWLFGSGHQYPGLDESLVKFYDEIMVKWPRFSRWWMNPFQPMLLVYHPDLVPLIIKSSSPKPRDHAIMSIYDMMSGWMGEGLLTMGDRAHPAKRKLLNYAFHFDVLRCYLLVQNEAADVLLSKLQRFSKQKRSFDMFHLCKLFVFDVIVQSAFAHKSRCQTQTTGEDIEYINVELELSKMLAERAVMLSLKADWLYRWTEHGRRWYKLINQAHTMTEKLIEKRRRALKENPVEGQASTKNKHMTSLVDILLTAKDENGKGMTPTEIRQEADTILGAGSETTSVTLSWILYSMAKWPQHQKRVQEEVDAVFKNRSSDEILWEDLNRFPYMTACIKEAMRLFCPVNYMERKLTKPISFDGHVIPAGTFVGIQIWCLHHNPAVWDRPHDYLPERFLGDNPAKFGPFQYIPFSSGMR